MATTFSMIYLGTGPLIDPTEGNNTAENAGALVGTTYGTTGKPLSGRIVTATTTNTGGTAGVLDQNNAAANDTFTTSIGGGHTTHAFDGTAIYNATITYADGTTATVSAVLVQDGAGHLFLAPEQTANTDTAAYEAKPIRSLTLNSIASADFTGLLADRWVTNFDDGVYDTPPTDDGYTDGTSGADRIDGNYSEPVAGGSDRVDSDDAAVAGTTGNDDHIRAGTGDDTVHANFGNDKVYAGDGNDSLYGGDGNDSLYGGLGNDTLSGGLGADVLDGGDGNDSLSGDDGNDSLSGGAGNDTLSGGVGSDTVDGGSGADFVAGGGDADSVTGGAGNDTLLGDAGTDAIYGGDGNDVIDGGNNTDTIYGGAGDDTIVDTGTTTSDDTIHGGDGNDSIRGGLREDLIFGDTGRDLLQGDEGADTLYGGADNDLLDGGAGNDSLSGGAGNDTVSGGADSDLMALAQGEGVDTIAGGETGSDVDVLQFSGATGGVTVTHTGAEAGSYTFGTGSGTFSDIEIVHGSASADTFNAQASTAAVNVDLKTGNDTFQGGAGNDSVAGGDGHDRVHGNAGHDTLIGDAGNDSLQGGAGDDALRGGAGDDRAAFSGPVTDYSFDYAPSGALIVTDTVAGRDGSDTLTGIEYLDFNGTTYRLVTGDDGSNTTLQGPEGEPALISAHDGNDWGGGHATSDAIFGGVGVDTLDGGDGDDTLAGDDGDDLLRGDASNDRLFGGTGRDTLLGGDGNDSLTGGDGADTYVFIKSGDIDRVSDFDTTLVNGRTLDQLDVSDLRNAEEQPVTWRDVTVGVDQDGNAVLMFPGGEQIVLEGMPPEDADGKQQMARMGVPCLVRGTRVLTPLGAVAIENLRAGMVVRTRDRGDLPVLWAGARRIGRQALLRQPALLPVRIAKGAIDNTADLWLSPQHGVVIGANLVRARHLADAGVPGVTRPSVAHVSYHHLLLPRHAILDTHGIGSETLYPGPMTAAALGPLAWAQLCGVMPALASVFADPEGVAARYGPRALPVLGRRDAFRAIAAATARTAKGNHPHNYARFAAN